MGDISCSTIAGNDAVSDCAPGQSTRLFSYLQHHASEQAHSPLHGHLCRPVVLLGFATSSRYLQDSKPESDVRPQQKASAPKAK